MRTCQSFDSQLSDHAFGTLPEADQIALEQHLQTCAACRATLAARQQMLAQVAPDRTEPDVAFWNAFTDDVMTRIEAPARPISLMSLSSPWILRAAAAVLLIATGIAIGQGGVGDRTPPPVATTIQTTAVTGAFDVLERSRTLLLDLVNTDASEASPNLAQRQRVAGELANRSAELYEELSPGEQARLRALLQDLEVILLQIAHIESGTDIPGIEMIQSGVDRSAVLFKIEMESLGRVTTAPSSN